MREEKEANLRLKGETGIMRKKVESMKQLCALQNFMKKVLPTLVRVFLCPCVDPIPLVGLTLTWSMGRKLALHVTLYHDDDDDDDDALFQLGLMRLIRPLANTC